VSVCGNAEQEQVRRIIGGRIEGLVLGAYLYFDEHCSTKTTMKVVVD